MKLTTKTPLQPMFTAECCAAMIEEQMDYMALHMGDYIEEAVKERVDERLAELISQLVRDKK